MIAELGADLKTVDEKERFSRKMLTVWKITSGCYFLSLFCLMWALVFLGHGTGFEDQAYIPTIVGALGLVAIIGGTDADVAPLRRVCMRRFPGSLCVDAHVCVCFQCVCVVCFACLAAWILVHLSVCVLWVRASVEMLCGSAVALSDPVHVCGRVSLECATVTGPAHSES